MSAAANKHDPPSDASLDPSKAGYSGWSIFWHWMGATLVTVLFFSHEFEPGGDAEWIHVSFGALAGVFLLWRVARRVAFGSPPKPDQHPMLNLLSEVVRWGILVSIVGVVLTGYLLPWSLGQPVDMSSLFEIPSPMSPNQSVYDVMDAAHSIFGHLFVPLVVLHFAGITKHSITKGGGYIMDRMLEPKKDGR
ncbi:MAG: cytochrome b/b6 domain-containing protein [Pseudomonadota bacterium]